MAPLEMNWLVIILVAAVGFGIGAVWYAVFSKQWMAASGLTESDIRDENGKMRSGPTPFIIAAVSQFILTAIFAGVIYHAGDVTLKNGVLTGVLCWVGFVLATMMVNNSFARRKPMQTVIDSGYWLTVLVVEGALLGYFGFAGGAG